MTANNVRGMSLVHDKWRWSCHIMVTFEIYNMRCKVVFGRSFTNMLLSRDKWNVSRKHASQWYNSE